MPIWCEPGEKKGGGGGRGRKRKVLPPPCKPFTFITTLNPGKGFESKSYILVLYEQWSVNKTDNVVKLDLDFRSWITSQAKMPTWKDRS